MAFIAQNLINRLTDYLHKMVEEEISMLIGVPQEVKRLRQTLQSISNVLEDAERKRIEDKFINDWLAKLKDVMYDAEDMLDECFIEAQKTKDPTSSSSSLGSCHFPLPSCYIKIKHAHENGTRMKELNLRLRRISEERSQFQLIANISSWREDKTIAGSSRASSPVLSPDIVGSKIEEDTDKVVEFLTEKDEREKILVYGITGIGGIGKTTLAQKVFNDYRVDDAFQVKIWLSVSEIYDEETLLRDILASMKVEHTGTQTKAQLEPMVKDALKNKKFLIVLDNVWNVSVWNDLLRNPLHSGAVGSRVLVTTRREDIAIQMKSVRCLPMEPMSLEEGWLLLCKVVVLGGDESEILWLKDIGMQILDKCGGLPLAIRAIAGVLCETNRSRHAWEDVLKRSEWSSIELPHEIHNALYLSYEDLPLQLKQCFLSCSLSRSSGTYHMQDIGNEWISEGLIRESKNSTLEKEAGNCYHQLIRRGMLQHSIQYVDGTRWQMHDLLRALGHALTRGENFYGTEFRGTSHHNTSVMKLRKLHIEASASSRDSNAAPLVDFIRKCTSLRYLGLEHLKVDDEGVNKICKANKHLRILYLIDAPIIRLPFSIQNLIHLRFLRLCNLRLRELPDSIGDLPNLLFLYLIDCQNLQNLPKSIVRLRNLRSINLMLTELEGMPAGLQNLKNLQEIWRFNIHRKGDLSQQNQTEWCNLEELSSLRYLRWIYINHLERAKLSDDNNRKIESIFRNNSCLEKLVLECTSPTETEEDKESIEKVFESLLSPPDCLEDLRIIGFFGRRFPCWISCNYLPNLLYVQLFSCNYCTNLPTLGMLPNLKYLRIVDASAVTIIGPEFLGLTNHGGSCSCSPLKVIFPKLEYLLLTNLSNLSEWTWDVEEEEEGSEGGIRKAFPCLKEFGIIGCPLLKSLPSGFYRYGARSLTALGIRHSGLEELHHFPSLRELGLENNKGLQKVSTLPKLEQLYLHSNSMDSLPQWLLGRRHDFPSLGMLRAAEGTAKVLRGFVTVRIAQSGLCVPSILKKATREGQITHRHKGSGQPREKKVRKIKDKVSRRKINMSALGVTLVLVGSGLDLGCYSSIPESLGLD